MTGWVGLRTVGQRAQSFHLDCARSTLSPSVSYNNHVKVSVKIINIKYRPACITNDATRVQEGSERLSPLGFNDVKRSVLFVCLSWGCR